MHVDSAAPTTAPTKAGDNQRIGLADDFDNFLQLLTTQLKSQDPLAPMDSTQFTEQLVQFTGVEQAIRTNTVLTELVDLIRADRIARSVDYLGAEVEAHGQTVRLPDQGDVALHYQLDQPAAQVSVEIYDSAGRLVTTLPGTTGPGFHNLSWDGRDAHGQRRPAGLYRIEIDARTADGEALPVATTLSGIVDGVEMSGERLLLSVEGVLVPLDAINVIRRPQA